MGSTALSVSADSLSMKLINIQKGLTILLKYFDYPNTEAELAESDFGVLWVSPTDRPVSSADVQELFSLGWKQDSFDGAGNRTYNPKIDWEANI